MPSSELPRGAAVIVLGASGAVLGRRVRDLLPGARLHAPRGLAGDWDEIYDRAVPHIAELFATGRPIVGLCASGILIRAVAPLIQDKHTEPPVVALAEDGSVAVPLLGGHHGANAMARALAEAFGGVAAVTTAGDLRLGLALDEPPPGWRIAGAERGQPVAAAGVARRRGGQGRSGRRCRPAGGGPGWGGRGGAPARAREIYRGGKPPICPSSSRTARPQGTGGGCFFPRRCWRSASAASAAVRPR